MYGSAFSLLYIFEKNVQVPPPMKSSTRPKLKHNSVLCTTSDTHQRQNLSNDNAGYWQIARHLRSLKVFVPVVARVIVQRWRLWIFHTLVNPHNSPAGSLDHLEDFPKITNSCRAQKMHDRQVSSFVQGSLECFELFLGSWRVSPKPVFNINTPVDDIWIANLSCKALAGPRTNCPIWWSEITA